MTLKAGLQSPDRGRPPDAGLKSLDQYILRQMWTPFLFATAIVTAIVWLTQSLQRIDIIVEYGQTLRTFGWLTLLIIPSLLAVIIPFCLFAATLFALQRLHADSEIAVMFAAGVSRAGIARPLLLVAVVGALATLWINIDLMPRTYRELKRQIADIRADFASAVIRGGEFMSIGNGFTVYVENAEPGGRFSGLLVHDYRNGANSETYMAERALLKETVLGPVLYLSNGNIQRINDKRGDVDIVFFNRTAINLGQFERGASDLELEVTERYLGELFHPDVSRPYDRQNADRLIGEGHGRLASPLYAFAYVLIAVFALIGGPYDRRGYAVRISLACVAVGALRITGYILQGEASEIRQYWLIYAAPLSAIAGALLLIFDDRILQGRRRPPGSDNRRKS